MCFMSRGCRLPRDSVLSMRSAICELSAAHFRATVFMKVEHNSFQGLSETTAEQRVPGLWQCVSLVFECDMGLFLLCGDVLCTSIRRPFGATFVRTSSVAVASTTANAPQGTSRNGHI